MYQDLTENGRVLEPLVVLNLLRLQFYITKNKTKQKENKRKQQTNKQPNIQIY